MELVNDIIMDKKYIHFSYRNTPFEDTITAVYAKVGTIKFCCSDPYEFLHSLYFVTSKGYYIKYEDFAKSMAYQNNGDFPFIKYLNGIIEAAKVLLYHASADKIVRFIASNMNEGMLYCTKAVKGDFAGSYFFNWTLPYYSYLSPEDRNN